ncbi:hypothetical protein SNOG_10627 [Parastagonospora nodorum SN15]|uniref:Uncharacterized protein n=1 Tax=Phaeosphaeria nodorum (strain SN15 / ATCC MYA-4574 / FGSC 10173) TaxID=321614 RepID=Q0UC87_PHANO|nr:hypothetical protein SNOG_10627 [Parastagonospora nodorum SN15]EAT82021.1 hypothetical protein SNOG_10627 [Parastagonospora nodorum SN15]
MGVGSADQAEDRIAEGDLTKFSPNVVKPSTRERLEQWGLSTASEGELSNSAAAIGAMAGGPCQLCYVYEKLSHNERREEVRRSLHEL